VCGQGRYGISPQGVEQVMDYKTVMVGLALDRPNDACLRVAGDIAERFGARIIGVAASDLRPPMYFDEEAVAIQTRMLPTWRCGFAVTASPRTPSFLKGRRRNRADREYRSQRRGGRRDCRRLRPLAIPRMGAQWRYPPPCN
jgi:hypothetical protein